MKRSIIVIFCSLFAFTSCEDDTIQNDKLEELGVLGEWKLESRTVDGISSLAVLCCDYLEFMTDNNKSDLQGEFKSKGAGYETLGVFEIMDNSIQFDFNDKQLLYEFEVDGDVIIFSYMEDNQLIIEAWRKE